MPRPNGDVYVCGFSDSDDAAPPRTAADAVEKPGRCAALHLHAKATSSWLRDDKYYVSKADAVYTAFTPDGFPLLGALDDVEGVYVSCGHTYVPKQGGYGEEGAAG